MAKMPPWPNPLFQNNIKLGLERIKSLLEILGNPHKFIPPVIHITGTNGKGSTLSFIRSILEHSGYKIHTYTSPHLVNFNERIRLASRIISDDEIFEYCEICRLAEEKLLEPVTFFEGATAMAFLAFSKVQADFTLLEVGMGGRLDSTNVIESSLASVITPISYDHTEHLGKTLSQIAFEKCGIFKPNSPAIISMQTDEANNLINEYAHRTGTELVQYEYDFGCYRENDYFVFQNKDHEIKYPLPSLPGDHQIINAACAIATIKHLNIKNVNDQNIKQALTNTYWPARLEKLNPGRIINALPSDWEIWVDGAHNDSGAQILAEWAKDFNDLYIICGMTRGRNSENFLKFFKDIAKHVVGVKVSNETMSYSGDYIADAAKKLGIRSTSLDSVEEGIDLMVSKYRRGKILICGSLYLAGEILTANGNLIC